jgi:methylmalonyl-CoA/ethylmalonyl-CoA epimerase
MKTDISKLEAGAFCQIGFVVKDVEKTAKEYADLFGIPAPKWFLTDTVEKAHTEYAGKPSTAQAKLAFFQIGSVSLELIEPVGGPSTWKDHLDTKGEGVHHIAFNVAGMDDNLKFLKAKNIPLIQKGDYTGGRYAYVDGLKNLKVVIELLENFK